MPSLRHLQYTLELSFSGKLDQTEFLFLIITDLSNGSDINDTFGAQTEVNWKENKQKGVVQITGKANQTATETDKCKTITSN